MVFLMDPEFWARLVSIVLIDLSLAGDNALVIALAVRSLPAREQWLGRMWGTAAAVALMGMAGAPFPYYIGYLQPSSAFGLEYAVNSIAMPMIGGTTSWIGPLIGAILLGSLQQIATVTISSAVNLLIVGLLLVGFVIIAPNGIVGLVQDFLRGRAK